MAGDRRSPTTPLVLKNIDRICPDCSLICHGQVWEPAEELTLESLILAQDERWRRA